VPERRADVWKNAKGQKSGPCASLWVAAKVRLSDRFIDSTGSWIGSQEGSRRSRVVFLDCEEFLQYLLRAVRHLSLVISDGIVRLPKDRESHCAPFGVEGIRSSLKIDIR
jgi:hypothetical protein